MTAHDDYRPALSPSTGTAIAGAFLLATAIVGYGLYVIVAPLPR